MPDRPVPFDDLQARLLPVADLVMVLMLSRPTSGTLRDTRVTVVTIWLSAAVAVGATFLATLGLILGFGGHHLGWLLAAAGLVVLGFGCADLALYGIRQRLMMRGPG